ncbi:LysR family transcriptional regulator [Maritimibacter sp. 55A14]|uniref:LysR family transcriptional regulator n=1 Tax=Maritimibacter sp. 55A14 TaxID=2174844 RepID=UPI000D61097D|nr:LysR family transcriptional regulator [Maritimibacter sp. 55A14]PWE33377.1 LysR family transcriptional regulator [Maritimibacter sp. 55A14]
MRDNDNLNRVAYFIAVMEEGTITAAADRLRVSKAVVSKQILLLEEELGTALLIRNPRQMHPTEAGQKFYEQGKAAVELAQEAFRLAREGNTVPKGRFRITAPLDYGTLHLAPLVARFVRDHPLISIDLALDDAQIDLVEQRFDMSFRVGWLADSSNLAQKVGTFEEWAIGSPGSASAGVRRPEDLENLPFVANSALKDHWDWTFRKAGRTKTVSPDARIRLNTSPAILNVVEAGDCFAILPDFLVRPAVAAGTLVRLLPDWSLRSGGIYAVTPPTRYKPLPARRFLELVREHHAKA